MGQNELVASEEKAFTLNTIDKQVVAFRACGQEGFNPAAVTPPVCSTDGGGAGAPTALINTIIRRLTPMECERLQGFPDGYTLIPGKYSMKKPFHTDLVKFLTAHFNITEQEAHALAGHPDGPRYKALGNSMAVPVLKWIGERIQLYRDITNKNNEEAAWSDTEDSGKTIKETK